MTTRNDLRRHGVSLVVLALVPWAIALTHAQHTPQFRTGVTVVPVEVRAVDRDGRSVTDLTAADFVIRDAGRPQEVAHFRAVSLTEPEADKGRTFFIVLGRGRLNQPTKALQALIDFVRTRALPRDRFGVVAYLRVIEATGDHEAVARVLEAYRDRHEAADGLLNRDRARARWPLPHVVGANTRVAMDAAFPSGGLMVRDLPGGGGNAATRHNDFNYLRRTLEYLQTVDGDKHAILVSQEPFGMGVVDDNPIRNFWFRLATSARTAVSYIHAGGIGSPRITSSARLSLRSIDPGAVKDYALVADQTGGLAAFYKLADQPLASIDRMTRHHYQLGYYPTHQVASTEYRTIEVTVTRPGVRLIYRHGYVAQAPSDRPEDYRFAVTEARLRDAAYRVLHPWPGIIGGAPIRWQMRLKSPMWTRTDAGGRVRVAVTFDPNPSWTTFVKDGAGYRTDIDLLLLADDRERRTIAERRVKLDIRLSGAEFARTTREWLTYEAVLDVETRPAFLRAVLYDFESDRTASSQVSLNPQVPDRGLESAPFDYRH